jgi:glycosyltransferase involved in cell wall biosynthesis
VELLRRSWANVLTSPNEGWGIANLEAAACGTASVASDAPGLRDSVVDGTTGYLVPHGDVGRLAQRLAGLLQDPDQRDRLGRDARVFAERFSWDSSALATEAFLRRLVTDSRHG